MHTAVTDLDKAFIHHVGGISNKSFVQILDADSDDNDNSNQPSIIQHSSYYDLEKRTSTLNNFKNKFSIFNSNIQSINAKIDELRIFVKCLQNHNFICVSYTHNMYEYQPFKISETNVTIYFQYSNINIIVSSL